MKKLMIMAIALLTFSSASWGKVLVGMVDIQKVLLAIDEGKSIRSKLEDFYKQKQTVLKKEEEKFKDLQQKYEKQKSVLNDSARQGKEKELRDLYVSIQDQTMTYQRELQEMENTLKKPLIDKIRGIVETVSKKTEADMTFESGSAALVYAQQTKDITEEVISAYNQKYPSKK